jgi:molecular chaperone DnaK
VSEVPAFGIDFGTTNSVVVVVSSPQRPAVPLLDAGQPHPSIVWYHPDGATVGREAKRNFHQFAEDFGHTFVKSVKRSLGRDVAFDVLGERVTATDVAAEIFGHLRKHAAASGFDISDAVVTIPVDFDGRARSEMRKAAAKAGIHITRFVHEPFAAVVGYYRGLGRDLADLPNETVLVFDWGGGTLDITLTKVRDGRLEEIATGGLGSVAGDRFDEHIRRWATSRFLERRQLRAEAFHPHPRKVDLFVAESERAKISLSENAADVVRLGDVLQVGDLHYDLEESVTRKDFEQLIESDLQDALHEVERLLDEARVQANEVDRVLLIGGSSLIPALQEEMTRRFGMRSTTLANSQTVIAEGAAAIGYFGYEPFLARPVSLRLADRSMLPIFGRETVIPHDSDKEVTLFVTDNRDGEARLIVEERFRDGDARTVQHLVLPVPVKTALPRPYNHERVYARFRIDDNLILHVDGHGAAAGQHVAGEIHDLKFGLRVR